MHNSATGRSFNRYRPSASDVPRTSAPGAPAFGWFALIHGAGNGILTIARRTLPLALFGPEDYGVRVGKIAAPSRIGQAIAPLLFGVLIERFGAGLLAESCALSLAFLAALFLLTPGTAQRVV